MDEAAVSRGDATDAGADVGADPGSAAIAEAEEVNPDADRDEDAVVPWMGAWPGGGLSATAVRSAWGVLIVSAILAILFHVSVIGALLLAFGRAMLTPPRASLEQGSSAAAGTLTLIDSADAARQAQPALEASADAPTSNPPAPPAEPVEPPVVPPVQ